MKQIVNKRPLFFSVILFVIGIALAYYAKLPQMPGWILTLAGAVVFLLLLIRKHPRAVWGLYAVMLGLGMLLFPIQYAAGYEPEWNGKQAGVHARVYERSMGESNNRYLLSEVQLTIEGATQSYPKLIELNTQEMLSVGDILEFETTISLPDDLRNPNNFNERMYLSTKNIGFTCYQSNFKVVGWKWGILDFSFALREQLSQNIDLLFTPENAPIAKAMILGIQDDLPQDLRADFAKTGIAHVLALSGLHVSVVVLLLGYLLKKMRLNRHVRFAILIASLLFFLTTTGFAPSIVRAVLLSIFLIIGRWTFSDRDTLTYLSVSAIVMLIGNATLLFSAGFLMSYAAMFGILFLLPPLSRLLYKVMPLKLAESLAVSIAASIAVAPLTAFYFGNISLLSLVTSLFAIPLTMCIVCLTGASAAFSLFFAPVAQFFAWLSEGCIIALRYCNDFFVRLNIGYLETTVKSVWVGVAVMALLFILSDYLMVRRRTKAILSGILCGVLVLGVMFGGGGTQGRDQVVILDVGTGDSIHIQAGDKNYFIDNGGTMQKSNVNDYVKQNKIVFDAVVVTNTKSNNLERLMETDVVGMMYTREDYEPKAYEQKIPARTYQLYDKIELSNTLALEVCAMDEKYTSLLLRQNGEAVCLFAQNKAQELMELTERVQVVKLSGGGAKGSMTQELLAVLQPKAVICSVKLPNQKELPDAQVLALLEQKDVAVYLTGERGAVTIRLPEGRIETIK